MQINSNEELLNKGKSMKTRNIVGIVLWFTIVGIIVSAIIALIDGIQILSTDFKNKELNDDKTLWGILALLLIGNIACLIFANKIISNAEIVSENDINHDFPSAPEDLKTKNDIKQDSSNI